MRSRPQPVTRAASVQNRLAEKREVAERRAADFMVVDELKTRLGPAGVRHWQKRCQSEKKREVKRELAMDGREFLARKPKSVLQGIVGIVGSNRTGRGPAEREAAPRRSTSG